MLFTYYLVADGPRLRRIICSRMRPDHQRRVLAAWELAVNKTGGYLYSRMLLAIVSALFHWIVFQAAGHRGPDPARAVGRLRQPVPARGRHLHRRCPAGGDRLHRLASEGARGARLHRRVPAARELLLRAAYHGAHDGAASGGGVRRGARRDRVAGRRRSGACVAGGGDAAGFGRRVGSAPRRDRERAHGAHRSRATRPIGHPEAMPGRFPADAFEPVAITSRSGFDESVHFGAAVVVDETGRIVWSIGDPTRRGLPAVGVQADAGRRDAALRPVAHRRSSWRSACASHDGTPRHVDVVRSTLAAAGLDESALGNTPDLPLDVAAAEAILSGRWPPPADHDELLGQARGDGRHVRRPTAGRSTATSTADHPLQTAITARIAELAGPRRPHRCRRVRRAGPRRRRSTGWPAPSASSPERGATCGRR